MKSRTHFAAPVQASEIPTQAAAMSVIIVTGGFFGSFVLSAIKRDLGVKDWAG